LAREEKKKSRAAKHSFVAGLSLLVLGIVAFFTLTPKAEKSSEPSPEAFLSEEPSLRAFREGASVQRIENLYRTEGKRIGDRDNDPSLTRERLRVMAKELKPEEIVWLKGFALNPRNSKDERFFTVYLLALDARAPAVAAVRDIALAELPPRGKELERMIRKQAVEGLGHECANQEATDALLDVISMQLDEPIRDAAHRALYVCKEGGPRS
jgi:hypothetical protein